MAGGTQEVGRYVLPIMASIEGIGPDIDRKLGKQFAGLSRQASQALAGGVRDGVAEAEAAIKKSTDAIAKLRDKEAAAVDKLAAAEARVEEVREKGGSALKRAEAQRNAAYRAQQAALREIEQQTRSLTAAQARLAEEQENAGRESGSGFLAGLRGGMAGAGSAGSEAAASFAEGFAGSSALMGLASKGGPVGAALAAAGLIGGGLLLKNVMAGIEREPGRDVIQARLRLDDASMAAAGKAAAKAYVENYGESAQDNLHAAQLAIQGGLVGDANDPSLTNAIEKLQTLSQLMGGDLSDTTKSASILMRTYGMSANDAFDIITRGYQLTGDLGGDWLDSLGEYSVGWKNAGLDAKQALALIKQGQDLGVDVTDRSADALREFGRRINEEGDTMVAVMDNIGLNGEAMYDKFKQGGPAAFEAFDQVFDKIRAIEDPARRGQAILAILGDTAGDFSEAFEQWDPSEAVAKFGDVNGAADEVQRTMGDNVVNSFEEAKRSIEQSMDDVQDKLADVFGPFLKEIADEVSEHKDQIGGAFLAIGNFAIDAAADVGNAAGMFLQLYSRIAGGIGNVVGAMDKFQAWQADIRGDHETARQLREQAEAAFAWGEKEYALSEQILDTSKRIADRGISLDEFTDKTDDSKESTEKLGDEIKNLPDQKDVKLNVTDAAGNPIDIVSGQPLFPTLGAGSNPFDTGQGAPSAGGPPPGFPGAARPNDTGLNLPGITGPGGLGGMGPGGRPTPGQGLFLPRSGLLPGQSSATPSSAESKAANRALAQQMFGQYFPAGEWAAFDRLVGKESGYDNWAKNPGSSAFGIGQFLDTTFAEYGSGATADPSVQLDLMFRYIKNRYGTPSAALEFHDRNNWYADGGQVSGGIAGKDSVHALLMPKEFVSTVDATERNLPWLEAMNAGLTLPRFAEGGLVPELEQVKRIASGFNLNVTSSRRDGDSGYHGRGLALDLSNGSANTPEMLAFAQYMAANFGGQLAELIYDAPGWSGNVKDGRNVGAFGDFYTMAQAGNHQNHVHVAVKGTGQAMALGNSSLAGPGGAQATSAFGAGYQPGLGTPGYNELGEPGYYQTDPRSVAQAQRRVEDTQQAIADADQRIVDAKKRRADLENDIKATAEDRAKADREITDAEQRARRAREDAQWAQQDAEEARQGKFTAAKKAKQQTGKDGAGDLSPLGGIFGSFLKETLGFDGSLFPDLAELAPIKLAGGLLSAFKGPILGAMEGGLGIQQPGWTPGAPVQVPQSASGLPFGMVPSPFDFANGQQPPGGAPPGTPASGIGAGPAPGPIDQSRHVAVTVNGVDENNVADNVRRQIFNADRVMSYAPKGNG